MAMAPERQLQWKLHVALSNGGNIDCLEWPWRSVQLFEILQTRTPRKM